MVTGCLCPLCRQSSECQGEKSVSKHLATMQSDGELVDHGKGQRMQLTPDFYAQVCRTLEEEGTLQQHNRG